MSKTHTGVTYTVDHIRNGRVIDSFSADNIVPDQGAVYLLSAAIAGGVAVSAWYIGLFEGNYTPVATDTAALFPGVNYASESLAYVETLRQAWSRDAIVAGTVANLVSPALFTMNATKSIYGAFLTSTSTKGGTTGTLLSAVRFPSPKNVVATDTLRVTGVLTLVNI